MENTKIKPASRRKQREVAVQLLFEMKMQKEENMDFILNYYESRELDIRNYTYTMQIAKIGVLKGLGKQKSASFG